MISAENGAYEGISINSLAIYPEETFEEYMNKSQEQLTHTKNIKIIKIDKKIQKTDKYNKTRIQLKVYASSPFKISMFLWSKKLLGERNPTSFFY